MGPNTERPSFETSLTLLERVRAGDATALEVLLQRYRPRLVRWASGRLPAATRDLTETQDIVQETMLQAFTKLAGINVGGEGALQAYLRQALLNRIRMEIRRAARKPAGDPVAEELPSAGPSPVEQAIGTQLLERYESALGALRETERELIVAHVEFGYSHDELARLFDKPSPDAARVALKRALVRLAEAMRATLH